MTPNKKTIRPLIPQAEITAQMSDEERFQNETLRPILKMQHSLLIQVFIQYLEQKKGIFFGLAKEQQRDYIQKIFMKDNQFKAILKGIVIGQLTVEEYKEYRSRAAALNKRMLTMLKERILTSLEEIVRV